MKEQKDKHAAFLSGCAYLPLTFHLDFNDAGPLSRERDIWHSLPKEKSLNGVLKFGSLYRNQAFTGEVSHLDSHLRINLRG